MYVILRKIIKYIQLVLFYLKKMHFQIILKNIKSNTLTVKYKYKYKQKRKKKEKLIYYKKKKKRKLFRYSKFSFLLKIITNDY